MVRAVMPMMIVIAMVIVEVTLINLKGTKLAERAFSKGIVVSRRDSSMVTSPMSVPVPLFLLHLLKHKLKYQKIDKVTTTTTSGPLPNCVCVPYYMCDSNNTIITDGMGVIDIRFRRCTGDLEVCCRLPSTMPYSPQPIPTDIPTGNPSSQPGFPPPNIMSSTMSPTMPPTMPPTMSSTILSTMSPITMPSNIPATMPTAMPLTMNPTMSPSLPPAMFPTFPSTVFPTMSSATAPTMAPTMFPTMSFTMPPTGPPTMAPTTASATTSAFSTTSSTPNCVCVPTWQCNGNGIIIVSGQGVIDPRQQFNFCPTPGQVCCRLPTTSVDFPTNSPIIVPSSPPPSLSTTTTCQPQICICVKTWQCDTNGFIIVSGAGSIDPRFPIGRYGQVGDTCVVTNEICCRIPPSGQDSSMVFPTDVVPLRNTSISGPVKNPGTAQACICVKSWRCSDENVVSQDGGGIIDPRFGVCPVANEVCCRLQGTINVPMSAIINAQEPSMLTGGADTSVLGTCGIRRTNLGNSLPGSSGETYFAEFPWMVALLVRQTSGPPLFQCGASLLNTRAVLTAAHCTASRNPSVLLVRVGEWDTRNNNEPVSFQESNIQTIVAHPQFYSGGLYHDVAVLILATPIVYAVNAVPICLPQQGMSFAPGTRCYATGWGRSAFGVDGQYQAVLRQIDLPIVEQSECQSRLRATRLGQYFQLHGSFICAGGEPSKDTCRGDGGGPLVCPSSNGQFIQAGIVSWGIGCGASSTPAVYASVSQHRQWIDQQLANYGVL